MLHRIRVYRRRAAAIAAVSLLNLPASAMASTRSEDAASFIRIYSQLQVAQQIATGCQSRFPGSVDSQLYAAWRQRNQVDVIDKIAELLQQSNQVRQKVASAKDQIREQVAPKLGVYCPNFTRLMTAPAFNPYLEQPQIYAALDKVYTRLQRQHPQQSQAKTATAPVAPASQMPTPTPTRWAFLRQAALAYRKPDQGPDREAVEAIILIGEIWGTNLVFRPYLLFKNGDVYNDFDLPLQDLDIAAGKRLYPKFWGQWQHEGDEYLLNFPGDKPWHVAKSYPTFPADRDERLDGVWHSMFAMSAPSVEAGMTDMSVAAHNIEFHADGRFALKHSTSASTSALGGTTAISAATHFSGRYYLDGYSITFSFDDGHQERVGFYFFANSQGKNKDVFGLAGLTYTH